MKRHEAGGIDNSAVNDSETLELIKAIRDLPRVRPGRSLSARVRVYSWFPMLGLRLENRREAARINRGITGNRARAGVFTVPLYRVAAATAVILLMAFGILGSLSLMAGNSKPGDALYSVKRLSENVEMAFTWNKSSRIEKSLTLANRRLSELDFLLESDRLTADKVDSVAIDYGERTRAVEEMLRVDGKIDNAGAAALELTTLQAKERNLEKKLAAAGPHLSLVPARGASLTVKDTGALRSQGAGSISVKTTADDRGGLTFNFDNRVPGSESRLEVYVEADGRSQILPVYPRACAAGTKARCSVSPAPRSVQVGSPTPLTAAFTGSDGSPLANRRVLLEDSSGTSSIDGTFGEKEFLTDALGRCRFTLTKESLDRVTRVTARVHDGTWQDLGEVLVTGGLRLPAEAGSHPVKATAAGPREGPQDIELDNGLLRLECAAGARDQVIGSVTCLSNSAAAGPLAEPAASGASAVPGTRRSGPELISSGNSSASYRVTFDIPERDGMLRKVYTVTVDAGSPYVVVDCLATVNGAASGLPLDAGAVTTPEGTLVKVGGRDHARGEETTLAGFDPLSPFATFEAAGGQVVYACPSDSKRQPVTWVLERGRLFPRLDPSRGETSPVTMMLAVTDSRKALEVQEQAASGLFRSESDPEPGDCSSSGFMVVADPTDPGRGVQRVTINVYKRYRNLLTGGAR